MDYTLQITCQLAITTHFNGNFICRWKELHENAISHFKTTENVSFPLPNLCILLNLERGQGYRNG